jgi:lysophospholipase L1-like esterase
MNKYRSSLLLAIGAALSLSACKPRLTPDAYSTGGLDFTRYVAVGNSLTAGYSDGSLYRSGQMTSYPAILSYSFSRFGPSDYKAPLLPGESGWPINPAAGYYPKRVLGLSTDCKNVTSLGPVLYSGAIDTAGSSTNKAAEGPFNNLGVPGIRAIDFLNPFYGLPGFGNPYAARFFSQPNPLVELSRMQPTFFTMWLGSNDVLAYATSGGSGKSSGGSPFVATDLRSISSVSMFAVAVDSVLNRLMPKGSTAKGAVLNIPDVTSIPFFTTVPYNGLALTNQADVDALNAAYNGTGISFTLGANPFVIEDKSIPVLQRRKAKPGELILLTVLQDSLKCAGWGSQKPIPAQYVLDQNEINAVQQATSIFNGILRTEAMSRGLAYVDMNAYLKTIAPGIQYNGVTMTTTFVKGGLFSLDGVHLTPRGYALVANEIIRTINYVYGASLQMADINSYNGVLFP